MVLAGRGQGFGELELEVFVFRVGGQGRSHGFDAAGLPGLTAEDQLGLDSFGFGLEKPAPLQPGDPGLGVLEPPLFQGDPCQPDLGRGQVGIEHERRVVLRLGGPGSVRSKRLASAAITSAGAGKSRSSQVRMTDSGCTPTKASTAWPSRKANTAGIDRTPNCTGQFGIALRVHLGQHESAVVLLRQLFQDRAQHPAGLHQAAQKSTTTGTDRDAR